MVLRLLSGIATGRNPNRHIGDLRPSPRRIWQRAEDFFANRTDADFHAWRYQRDSTAWKYAMWDGGFKLPTQLPTGRSKCSCGADLTIGGVPDHIRSAHRLNGNGLMKWSMKTDRKLIELAKTKTLAKQLS
jgi:hypothetical protein